MTDTKLALDIYSLHEATGAQTRARAKWIQDGERNTKYFIGLEKSRSDAKIITSLKNSEGQICSHPLDIMNVQLDFYKSLYKEKFNFTERESSFKTFCDGLNIPTLSQEERTSCEGLITEEESLEALKQLRSDSSPGISGLTAGFYKFFWNQINDLVVASFNEAFVMERLSTSQRRAIITLIHKGKQLCRHDLGNWRPISLTCTDYKILTKVLAIRMQGVIKTVINDDQVGYIRGRNISTIVRLIDDLIEFINVNNATGAIIALDYSKAFDTINKVFLMKSFELYGFGPDFINWVKTIMTDTYSCINYCGWLSEFFPVQCGIRQGCPFSPLAFVLAVELFAIKVRNAKNIQGIDIPGRVGTTKVKLQQYADDTTLFPKDENDIKHLLKLIDLFSFFSGLKLNKSKTEAMYVGRLKNCKDKIGDIRWNIGNATIKILGFYFSNFMKTSEIDRNWTHRIENIERLIHSWEKRDLSIHGKVLISKTFLLSQLTYVLQSLILPDSVLKKVNLLLYKFLWKKRTSNKKAFEKVRRDVLSLDYTKGGIKMINVFDLQYACVIKWMQRMFCNPDAKYASIPWYYYELLGKDMSVLRASVSSKEFIGIKLVKSQYWRSALKIWLDNNNCINKLNDVENVANQPLWNNALIKYKNKPIMFPNWVSNGFTDVGDLFFDNNYVSLERVANSVGPYGGLVFDYYALLNALPRQWRVANQVDAIGEENPTFCGKPLSIITVKNARELLIVRREKQPCCVNFWQRKFPGFVLDKPIFIIAYRTTNETRLRNLQWKIIHNIYPTSILLSKMGITNSPNCSYCNVTDFIEHFFCTCQVVIPLWKFIEHKASLYADRTIVLSDRQILFGMFQPDFPKYGISKLNHVILIAKLCISKFKYGNHHNLLLLFQYELKLRGLKDDFFDVLQS
jgi:hypothetical protein